MIKIKIHSPSLYRPARQPCSAPASSSSGSLVEDGLAVVGHVIFVQRTKTLIVASQQQHGLLRQLPGIFRIAVAEQSPENKVVDAYPYRSLPGRRIAAGTHVVHFLQWRKGTHTCRRIEQTGNRDIAVPRFSRACSGVAIPAHNAMKPLHTLKRCIRQSKYGGCPVW